LRENWSSVAGVLAIGLLLFDTFAGYLPRTLSDMFRLAVGVCIAALAARNSLSLSDRLRYDHQLKSSAWRLLGVGSIVTMVGWGLYASAAYVFRLPVPANWVDWFYVVSSLFAAAGLLMLTFSWPHSAKLRVMLDSAIATSCVVVLSWYFVLSGLWHQAKPGLAAHFLAIAEPGADTILIFSAIVVLICGASVRLLSRSVILVTSGCLAIGLGAMSTHLAKSFEILALGQFPRFLVHVGWLLIAISASAWNGRAEAPRDLRFDLRKRLYRTGPWSAIGPYFIALVSFGLVAFQELIELGSVSAGVFLLSALLMGLIVMRQLVTLHENQALADAVSKFNEDLEKVVELRTSQLNSLYSFSKAIGNSLDLESVIAAARTHAGEAFNADAVILNLVPFAFNTHANTKPLVRTAGLDDDAWVLEQLNILETHWTGSFGTLHDANFKNHFRFVLAPVLYKGKSYGWIAALREPEPFGPEDVAVLEGLGMEIGTALENARLYDLAKQMADVDPVTGLLNHRAAQQRFDFAFKYAKEQEETLSILMLDVDNFKHFNDTYGHLAGDHVLKTVARVLRDSVRPHDVPARYGGDEFLVLMPQTSTEDAEALARKIEEAVSGQGYPEPGSDRVIPFAVSIGWASFPEDAKSRHDMVTAADRHMYKVKRAAQSGAPAPTRTNIRREASANGFDLLDSMITAVDNKDYYTRAHSEEVTEYALWIAEELGLSEEAQRTIRLAGLLHDVGKIGIPDEILRKPGHLTDEEFDVMKQHPEVGAFMVGNIPGLTDIVPGVRHHHEKWDGSGYPAGLAGEAIPYLGRILAVPDVFSALTTERPYRKGMDWDRALEHIRAGAGSHFDPKIVEAFDRAVAKRRAVPLRIAA